MTLVRSSLQYGTFFGEFPIFLFSWFLHYGAIGIVSALVSSFGQSWKKRVMPHDSEELTMEKAVFVTSTVAIFSSVFIFVVANWPNSVAEDY